MNLVTYFHLLFNICIYGLKILFETFDNLLYLVLSYIVMGHKPI